VQYTERQRVSVNNYILHGFAPGLCKLQKGCTRLAVANAKAYQLLAHGGWFSQDTPASCTSKKGCHDLAEDILCLSLGNICYKGLRMCPACRKQYPFHSLFMTYHTSARNREIEG
jgi:hypothetical protein